MIPYALILFPTLAVAYWFASIDSMWGPAGCIWSLMLGACCMVGWRMRREDRP